METKNNIIGNINSVEEGTKIGIKSTETPFLLSFSFQDYYDEKQLKKFIKRIERLVRSSREYKTYIELLRTNFSVLNKDNLLSNITSSDCDLEFHHYPFSLYDLIEVIIYSHIYKNEEFTSFKIAKEIMELHYKNLVGLVSLTHTTHELAHSGNIFLSRNQIFGNYTKFMEEYTNFISPAMKEKIKKMEENSAAGIPSDFKGVLK